MEEQPNKTRFVLAIVFVLIFIYAQIFSSCTNNTNESEKIESFTLESDLGSYLQEHNAWKINDAKLGYVEDSLLEYLIPIVKKNAYSSIPLKFTEVREYGNSKKGGFAVLFEFDRFSYPVERLASRLKFYVTADVDKEMIDTLKQDQFYKLDAEFVNFTDKEAEIRKPIVDQNYDGDVLSFYFDEIDLPKITVKIKDIKPYTRPEVER